MGKRTYTVATLRNALEILDQFMAQETWSLMELADRLEMSKSRVFRILSTFEECGYLHKDAESGRYKLGMRLFGLGNAAVKYEQLRWQALPPLQRLAELTGETVHVGIMYEGEAVCVQLVDGQHVVRMHSWVGKRSPAHASTLGKVVLAHYPESEVDAYVAKVGLFELTPHTFTEPTAFKEHLREIRNQGYAIDDEEMELGLRCLGAPITDHTGRVVATVSVSAPTIRMSRERAKDLVPAVQETARTISRILGSPSLFSGAV